MTEYRGPERRGTGDRKLTEADIEAIKAAMTASHSCRFDNVSREDMDLIKDLLTIYRDTRSDIIKWFVKGALTVIILAMGALAYLRLKGD